MAMEAVGHECVGFCEIDKYAVQSYRAIYDTKGEFYAEDITRIDPDDLPDFDCITGGFPCQSFSIAGQRGGFDDIRGTLFFDIARIVEARKPRLLLLENVKGLLNHDRGRTFRVILSTLDELGYDLQWQLLNSKDFGVPQNRERIFIVGHSRNRGGRQVFPLAGTSKETYQPSKETAIGKAQQISDGTGIAHAIDRSYHKGLGPSQVGRGRRTLVIADREIVQTHMMSSSRLNPNQYRVYDKDGIAPTINTSQCGGRIPHIECTSEQDTEQSIRRLTPRECWRLQAFPDWAFNKAQAIGLSDTQLYKQAGNSVTVSVVYEIARKLKGD